MKNNFTILFFFFLCVGCYQAKEGCVDPVSSNYDLSADKNCCCAYPVFSIRLTHSWQDSLIFRYNDTIVIDGTPLVFLNFQYFISQCKLVNATGSYSIIDTVNYSFLNSSGLLEEGSGTDDIILASRNQNTYSIGAFSFPDTYDSLHFFIGLTTNLSNALPESFPPIHPLAESNSIMRSDSQFLSMHMSFVRFLPEPDTLSISFKKPIVLQLHAPDNNYNVTPGFDFQIPITIRYDSWFDGVDFTEDSISIHNSIVKNTPKAFIWTD